MRSRARRSRRRVDGLQLYLDEVGWQVDTAGLDRATPAPRTSRSPTRRRRQPSTASSCAAPRATRTSPGEHLRLPRRRARGRGFQAALYRVDGHRAARGDRRAVGDRGGTARLASRRGALSGRVLGAELGPRSVCRRSRRGRGRRRRRARRPASCLIPGTQHARRLRARVLAARSAPAGICAVGAVQPNRATTLISARGAARRRSRSGLRPRRTRSRH